EEPGPARPADPASCPLSSDCGAQGAREPASGDPARAGTYLPAGPEGSRTGNRSVPRRTAFGPFDPHPDAHRPETKGSAATSETRAAARRGWRKEVDGRKGRTPASLETWFKKRRLDAASFMRTRTRGSPS